MALTFPPDDDGKRPSGPERSLHMAIIYEDDYGVTHCECGQEIACNDCGDFPDECPKCKGILDWSEWVKENSANLGKPRMMRACQTEGAAKVFVIRVKVSSYDEYSADYYTGSKYRANGEAYAVLGGHAEAKQYKSQSRAEAAARGLEISTYNASYCEVEPA
jgi:hypothetical protein